MLRDKRLSLQKKIFLSLTLFQIFVCAVMFLLFSIEVNIFTDLSQQETTELIENKYKSIVKNTTDMAVSLTETIYGFDFLTDEQKLSVSRQLVGSLKYGREGYFYAYEKDTGVNLIHGDKPQLQGRNLWDFRVEGDQQYIIQELNKVALSDDEYFHNFLWTKPDREGLFTKIGTAVMVPNTNMWIGTGAYIDTIENEVSDITKGIKRETKKGMIYLLSSFVALLILIIVFIIFLGRSISRPIIKLHDFLLNTGGTDFSKSINIDKRFSKDEIHDLYEIVNKVIFNFSELIKQTKDTTQVITKSISELTVSSKQIFATSNSQSASVKEIVTTMEDSDKLSKSIAVKIDEVSKISSETKELVQDGFTFIESNLNQMQEIKSSNAETIKVVKDLGEQIESIWDVVNIINSVADQTKIIAFNAELEATAAGEVGKNFQIVATEIRRLADNTVSSTEEIKRKINEIQKGSDNLILSSENGTSLIKDGYNLTVKLKDVFQKILLSSEISAQSAGQIVASVNQQVSSFDQIVLTLKHISDGIDEFTVSTKSSSETTKSLQSTAETLNETLKEYII